MKKSLSLLLAICFVLMTFTSCSLPFFGNKDVALVISGTEISKEIYNYYLDIVKGRPGDYGLADNPSDDVLKKVVIELCKRYLAINTEFASMELKLSAADKVEISDNVNSYWVRFENHYNTIGVSKQTLTKIFTCQAYENAVFSNLYDKGTGNAEGEKEIKAYFNSEYVAIRTVCAYYISSDGSTQMSESDRAVLKERFGNIAVESENSYDLFSQACSNYGYTASDIIVISSESEGYPSGFYDSVLQQKENTVKIIEYGDCIFAVRKESLNELGDSLYSEYRATCIQEMHSEEWEKAVAGYMSRLKVEKDYM